MSAKTWSYWHLLHRIKLTWRSKSFELDVSCCPDSDNQCLLCDSDSKWIHWDSLKHFFPNSYTQLAHSLTSSLQNEQNLLLLAILNYVQNISQLSYLCAKDCPMWPILQLQEQLLLADYKCIILVQFSQFYVWNCLEEFLEWPGSPPRILIIIFNHENSAKQLD